MKLKDLTLSKQINIYFGSVALLLLLLVINSFISVHALWNNTYGIYNNPLTVRRAVGEIKANVLSIHRDMHRFSHVLDMQEAEQLIIDNERYEANIDRQLNTLYDRYLGPQSDIEETAIALNKWKAIRTETMRLYREGQIEEVKQRVKVSGVGGMQAEVILNQLEVISNFATTKSDEFFQTALLHRNRIVVQIIILFIGILASLMLIARALRKNILPPLLTLKAAAQALDQGKLDTRIDKSSPNELGDLSRSFNAMAQTIEREIRNKEKAARISSVMFKHDALRPFCKELLENLQCMTGSQISAIYFLDDSNSRFERYESIGAKHDMLSSFSVAQKEGEFGAPLASRQIQHITDIPAESQMIFSTVSGDLKVKEIITVPIIQGENVISMISLASIKPYQRDVLELMTILMNEITASINAVVSSQKIIEFSQKLQTTNEELTQQARELEMQAQELNEQNTELDIQKKQLEEASRLKTNFLSNMSHELRTPLNSVIALSGVLGRRLADKIPQEEWSYLQIIERNGQNLLRMINDILDISRIEAGREEIDVTRFNPNDTIAELVAMMQIQAQQQHIELVHSINSSEMFIESDATKLRHILLNLLSNAIKFTEKGSVEIEATQKANTLEVTVKDTGIGISKEHLSLIFDEFRQADGSTSRKFGGTGLGLAIAKKYATLIHATITVESKPEEGSVFTLTLPLQYDDEGTQGEIAKESAKSSQKYYSNIHDLSGKNILLVEDNEGAIIQIKDLVENLGCTVQAAHNAVQAFSFIEEAKPDAIILDLMMPDIDGFKVLEVLRNAESTERIPVLILTAKHLTKEDLKFLKRNNVHQLIQKGDVKREELQQAISAMLYPKKPVVKALPKQFQSSKPLVLVIEDNKDNMITVEALLDGTYSVIEAFDAQEGLEMVIIHEPDLILMDIALPDTNGIELFKKIKKLPQTHHIPVIALTASVMKHDRETILSYGFDAFIGKPIITDEFFATIDEVLHGK